MAPEQIEGRWRDQGPWTDLYALGCVAYRLIAGEAPFLGDTAYAILKQHVQSPVPPFPEDVVVPEGFRVWLRALLAKSPRRRFRSAADAAYALMRLSPLESDAPIFPGPGEVPEDAPTQIHSYTGQSTAVFGRDMPELEPLELTPDGRPAVEAFPLPPIPQTWERDDEHLEAERLLRTGLDLFNLRSIPMVDRNPERTLIWDALRRVQTEDRPRCVLIRGAIGTGKSRLAEWIGERATEVGAAQVLRASHGDMPGPRDGLGGMVARHLSCFGLRRRKGVERVRSWYADEAGSIHPDRMYDAMTLVDMMGLEHKMENSSPLQSTPVERRETLRRFIERVARSRPVVLWFDDVQWGREAAEFALYLARTPPELPALILCTVQEEAAALRPTELDIIEQLAEQEACDVIEVGALTEQDQRELVERLAGLDGGVATQLARRTEGNPLFAVQLLGDCIERGILVPSDEGFVLAAGASPELPDDVRGVLQRRLALAVDQLPKAAQQAGWFALELAAALGSEIVHREWEAACDQAGRGIPGELLDRLAESRLIRQEESSWRFVHAMLRETLERRAEEAGRRADHHRACARMVSRLPGVEGPRQLLRQGRHLVEARDWEDALDPLVDAAYIAMEGGDARTAYEALDVFDRAARTLALPHADRRWIRANVQRAYAGSSDGDIERARPIAEKALAAARRNGDPDLIGSAYWVLGVVDLIDGSIDRAVRNEELAIDFHRRGRDQSGLGRALASVGYALIFSGRLGEALERSDRAIEVLAHTHDHTLRATAFRMRAQILAEMRRFDDARRACLDAVDVGRSINNRYAIGDAFRSLARVERRAGRPAAVRQNVERAKTIYEDSVLTVARFDLALQESLMELDYGQPEKARKQLTERIDEIEPSYVEAATARFALAALAAMAGFREEFREHVEAARPALVTGKVDQDIAAYAERAGSLAREAGWEAEAVSALEVSRLQFENLGLNEDARRVRRRLAVSTD